MGIVLGFDSFERQSVDDMITTLVEFIPQSLGFLKEKKEENIHV